MTIVKAHDRNGNGIFRATARINGKRRTKAWATDLGQNRRQQEETARIQAETWLAAISS